MNIHDSEVQAFLAANRAKLFAVMPLNSCAIIYGPFFNGVNNTNRINSIKGMASSVYDKNQNLYWLTGIDDPEANNPISSAFFVKNADGSTEFTVFTGHMDMQLFSAHQNKIRIYDREIDLQVAKLRLIKSDFEIAKIRAVTDVTSKALIWAMKNMKAGMSEQNVKKNVEDAFKKQGYDAEHLSFATSVSGDNNINCTANESLQPLNAGNAVFINAGARNGMTTDITAQFPVDGQLNKKQIKIYTALLAIRQKIAIEVARKDTTPADIERVGLQSLHEELIQLDLLQQSADISTCKKYFTDSFFRWVGFNLFDPCPYVNEQNQSIKLTPGMVFAMTVSLDIPKHINSAYAGISMSIRDVYVMTVNGPENICKVPRSIADIERCMATSSATDNLTFSLNDDANHSNPHSNNNSNNNSAERKFTF